MPSASLAEYAALALALNLFTFIAFGFDKFQARRGGWRIPEKSLLLLCSLGGSPAGLLAMRHFRHKRQKQPFKSWFHGILALQALLVLLVLFAQLAIT